MAADITQLVLPTISDNCRHVIEILSSNEPDLKALVATIDDNETLSNAIIKYSNSPFHHRDSEISNVTTAVNLLGFAHVYNAVVATVLRDYVEDNVTGKRILQHCAFVSAMGSLIASKTVKPMQHKVELLGLLHDLPSLVLSHNFKAPYRDMVKSLSHTSPPLVQLELERFGLPRGDLIAAAIRQLSLPQGLSNTLEHYHAITEPAQAEAEVPLAILCLAHHVELNIVPESQRILDLIPGDRQALLAKLSISEEDYDILINQSSEAINEHIALVT